MTTKRSLADLAAAFTSKTSEGGGNATWKLFFPFWKAEVDTVSTVRFLPDADAENPMGFLVENLTHELNINGKREKVACLKMYGETCPICELSARFYDKNSAEYNEDLGKQFYRKKSYIGQVLVLETPIEHDAEQLVKLIEFGPQVFKQIQAAFQSGDLEEAPYELKGGYNFRFRKTKTGSGQNSYTTSNFAPKQTDVGDNVIESMNLYNLSEYRTAKTDRTAVEAMLVAASTGGTYEAPAADAAPAPAPAAKAAPKAAAALAASAADDDGDSTAEAAAPAPAADGKLSVVEQLRQRAAAAKAAAQGAA
jgi:hypothetical protein